MIRIQNMMFNLSFVRYLIKVDNKDGKFFIGVFSINDKEFYFEYPSAQRRNEDWDRVEREFGSSLFLNKEISKG